MKRFREVALALLLLAFVLLSQPANVSGDKQYSALQMEQRSAESYDPHGQIWIQSNEEFAAMAVAEGWHGDGSEESPYVITGYFFDCESQPLRVWHTTAHWIFIDNIVDGVGNNVQCGTWVENVTHGRIVDNEFYNRHAGISVVHSRNLNITGNYIHDCTGTGIEFTGGINGTIVRGNVIDQVGGAGVYSSMSRGCVIDGNTISNCGSLGIGLVGTSPECNVTTNTVSHCDLSGVMMSYPEHGHITGNTIHKTTDQGISLNTPHFCVVSKNVIGGVEGSGVKVSGGTWTEVSENTVGNCSNDGIFFNGGTNASISWNIVSNVTGRAVNLGAASSHITVRWNGFLDCGVSCQVRDDGTYNLFTQNYYSDWTTPDANQDGYVDAPYEIEGDAANEDMLPLAAMGVIPTVTPSNSNQLPQLLLIGAGLGIAMIAGTIVIAKRR